MANVKLDHDELATVFSAMGSRQVYLQMLVDTKIQPDKTRYAAAELKKVKRIMEKLESAIKMVDD